MEIPQTSPYGHEGMTATEPNPVTASEDAAPLRVLLADDHDLVRDALAQCIARESDLDVVASVEDTKEIVVLAGEMNIDVVILDIDIPGPPVFQVVTDLARDRPQTAVILLSGTVRAHDLEQALNLGVPGFVAKSEPISSLLAAVRAVGRGGTFFSPAVDRRISEHLSGGSRLVGSLTPREVEVMQHVARGRTKREAADLLSISVKTVESHVQNLMKKLDVHNNVELTRFAIREGFVRP